jgi:hypothetical protein
MTKPPTISRTTGVLSNGVEIGADWLRIGQMSGKECVSLSISGPELGLEDALCQPRPSRGRDRPERLLPDLEPARVSAGRHRLCAGNGVEVWRRSAAIPTRPPRLALRARQPIDQTKRRAPQPTATRTCAPHAITVLQGGAVPPSPRLPPKAFALRAPQAHRPINLPDTPAGDSCRPSVPRHAKGLHAELPMLSQRTRMPCRCCRRTTHTRDAVRRSPCARRSR